MTPKAEGSSDRPEAAASEASSSGAARGVEAPRGSEGRSSDARARGRSCAAEASSSASVETRDEDSVEITKAMMEAGTMELCGHDWEYDSGWELVERIFRAMIGAREGSRS